MKRPSPLPGNVARVRRRTKRSNTRSRSAGGTPRPWSVTRRRPRRRCAPTETRIVEPGGGVARRVLQSVAERLRELGGVDLDREIRRRAARGRACARRGRRRSASPRPRRSRRSPPVRGRGRAAPESRRTTSISSVTRRSSAESCSRASARLSGASASALPVLDRAAGRRDRRLQVVGELGEERRLHLLARPRRLGLALEAQEPLALDGQAEQQRAGLGHALARLAGRAPRARPPAGVRPGSGGRCRFRRAPTDTPPSCPGGKPARRCPRDRRSARSRSAARARPSSSASRMRDLLRSRGPGEAGRPRRRAASRGSCRRGSPGRAGSGRSGRGARPRAAAAGGVTTRTAVR